MTDPRKRTPSQEAEPGYFDEDENVVDDDLGTQYDEPDYGGATDGNTVVSDADPGL